MCNVCDLHSCRTGSDEILTEKIQLLSEISDLLVAGQDIIAEKRLEKKQKAKDAKKRIALLKKGKDLRLRAMRRLGEGVYNKRLDSIDFSWMKV